MLVAIDSRFLGALEPAGRQGDFFFFFPFFFFPLLVDNVEESPRVEISHPASNQMELGLYESGSEPGAGQAH